MTPLEQPLEPSLEPTPEALAEPRTAVGEPEATIVAVDLGSNSFHLLVARLVGGEPHVVDRLRERVVLAEGLDAEKRLSRDARDRALRALERFGERLRDVPAENVRAVGTSALRQARNVERFLERAEDRLGHEIEIISGNEEARLIYLGVAHDVALAGGRRLVIDIGGGSTECIVGEGFDPLRTDSLHMGCVNYTRRYFRSGRLSAKAFDRAELAARRELQPVERTIRELGWEQCVGSSGTVLAIESALMQNGWTHGGVDQRGLRKLRKALIQAGHVEAVDIPGIAPERRGVIAGGLAILTGACMELGIDALRTSTSALRDGLVYDVLGRIRHEDTRERAVADLARRYHVDGAQAERVAETAQLLFAAAAPAWRLRTPEDERLLRWAAQLHEIGLSINYGGHHHHGAYIVNNVNLPGFAREEQARLAALVQSHRRKLAGERLAERVHDELDGLLRLVALLRLAVLLNRSRAANRVPPFRVEARKASLTLEFPLGWLDDNPMTRADLGEERGRLAGVGLGLEFGPVSAED